MLVTLRANAAVADAPESESTYFLSCTKLFPSIDYTSERTMSHPPTKRPRPSEDSQDQPSTLHTKLEPDEEFWVTESEKNVVLVCRNVKFRVSQELLASASSVLSELLSSTASDDTSEDGCISVCLSDSPEDMRHFLRALTSKTQEW